MNLNDLLFAFHKWYYNLKSLSIAKSARPIRFGVLGAADFSPIGLFDPASSHPDVEVVAVSARSLSKAQAQAKAYGIPRAYGSYDELLQQPDIDAVYVPLPVAFHAEWAIKAMKAGKHVLIEKVMSSNAEEARQIRDCARQTGKVAMEAFHWQFHPATHVAKALVDSGRYGRLLSTSARLVLPQGMFAADDIRLNYSLGGGACTDLAYVFSATRHFVGSDGEYEVVRATPRLNKRDKNIDEAMEAEMVFRSAGDGREVRCRVQADLAKPRILGILPATMGDVQLTLELEKGTIKIANWVAPHIFHSITIADKVTGIMAKQKHYNFGPKWKTTGDVWWTTYRYQLEAFVAKLKGEVPAHWVDLDESVGMAELIDNVYEKAGMIKRGQKLQE